MDGMSLSAAATLLGGILGGTMTTIYTVHQIISRVKPPPRRRADPSGPGIKELAEIMVDLAKAVKQITSSQSVTVEILQELRHSSSRMGEILIRLEDRSRET